ncbi:MAG: hypothetical protein EA422_13790 [Gemmatimonadales bacterium]|nr:MAG: hypothetical protein EA422_13790 [Gemmatimonadales bacterium]
MTRGKFHNKGRWVRLILAAVLIPILTAGCFLRSDRDNGDPFQGRDRSGPMVLEVMNDNFNDARIYTLWNGNRRRIGTVIGKTQESFEIPVGHGDLRVQVDFIAAGSFITDPITVWPGEVVQLVIPSASRGRLIPRSLE